MGVAHSCNSQHLETEAGGSVQGQPQPHSDFEDSLGYVKFCLLKKEGMGAEAETGRSL